MRNCIFIFCLFITSFEIHALAQQQQTSLRVHLRNPEGALAKLEGQVELWILQEPMKFIGVSTIQEPICFDSLPLSVPGTLLLRVVTSAQTHIIPIRISRAGIYDTTIIFYPEEKIYRLKSDKVKVSIPHWFVFVNPQEIVFEETIEIQNNSQSILTPADDTSSTFIFYLPPGAGLIDCETKNIEESDFIRVKPVVDDRGYKLRDKILPGKKNIRLRYWIPRDSMLVITHRWAYDIERCNLLLFPDQAKLIGEPWKPIADDTLRSRHYALYRTENIPSGSVVILNLDTRSVPSQSPDHVIKIVKHPFQAYSIFIMLLVVLSGWIWIRKYQKKN